jgi:predicted pyridoxine 5'-phosphate oxidase superfamily flavin-nucleotide-binding protein
MSQVDVPAGGTRKAMGSGTNPYHAGELAVQRRAGVVEMAARIGRGIHHELAPAAAAFLAERSFVVVASRARDRRVWASLLTGPVGFLAARDPRTLVITAVPVDSDPLRAALAPGAPLGLVAIDFATRRRYRVNGSLREVSASELVLDVVQAYGNCPKYIQQRDLPPHAAPPTGGAREVARGMALSAAQRSWIATADTFFVASAHPEAGADASHRGGDPGFVTAPAPERIVWPDYSGNTMFQTLGNIVTEPATGLLFLDFARGAVLQVSGDARVVWDEAEVRRFAGAERLIDLTVAQVIETERVLPVGWRGLERSPFNPR